MPYLYGMNQTNPHTMQYAVTTTSANQTQAGALDFITETVQDNMNLTDYVFTSFKAAQNFAAGYAAATGAFYVQDAQKAPTLKAGQTWVRVQSCV